MKILLEYKDTRNLMELRMAHGLHSHPETTACKIMIPLLPLLSGFQTLQAFCGLGLMTAWLVQVALVHLLKGGVDSICQEQVSSKSGTALAK
jgi:hypothetical protein